MCIYLIIMREFYFEDKIQHFAIIGASPKNDINCKPFDYFMYSYAHVAAETYINVASHIEKLGNIEENYFYQFALEQIKENNNNIMRSTYPLACLQQILVRNDWNKNQQKKLWDGVVLRPTDIFWFNWLSQQIGYLLDIYHVELLPKQLADKQLPMCFTQEEDGSFRKIGSTNLSEGKMRGILEQRKVLQARIYHRDNTWHCFYFTYRGLAGKEPGMFGSTPHYHYISDKFGVSLEELKKRLEEGNMLSSKIHIQIKK